MKTPLRVLYGGTRKPSRQEQLIHCLEWVAGIHWVVYPLLVVAFFWWLAYGHR
jgi:hypothetical protein